MINRIKRSVKGGYAKSMALLMSGSAIAQLITIAVAPITTRLFSPQELGVYTLIISSVNMFGMVLSLRYDMSIVYETEERNVYPLVALSTIICFITSLLVSVGYWFYFSFISRVDYSALGACVFIFFLCFVFGLINILSAYNNRLREYGVMMSSNVYRTAFQNGLIVLTGLGKLGETGLLLAQTIGYCAGLRRQSKSLLKEISAMKAVTKGDLSRVAHKHSRQAMLSAPASFANGFSYTAITYFVEYLYGVFVVGLYSISFRVLGLPISIVSANVARVFMKEAASQKDRTGNYAGIFVKTLIIMIGISVPITLMLVFAAPSIFEFVFGVDWREAGVYVQLLTPMFMLRFIAGGLNPSTMISDRQGFDLIIQISLIIAVFASFGVSVVLHLKVASMFMILSSACSIVYIFAIYFFWRLAKCQKK